jgi:hypothetical protein
MVYCDCLFKAYAFILSFSLNNLLRMNFWLSNVPLCNRCQRPTTCLSDQDMALSLSDPHATFLNIIQMQRMASNQINDFCP